MSVAIDKDDLYREDSQDKGFTGMTAETLYNIPCPVIIITDPEGKLYTNQVNGICCDDQEHRGTLLYLFDVDDSEWPYKENPNKQDVAFMKHLILQSSNDFGSVEIEDDWITEAWLNVKFTYKGVDYEGILTYCNSD
jgi:hypothetical protein